MQDKIIEIEAEALDQCGCMWLSFEVSGLRVHLGVPNIENEAVSREIHKSYRHRDLLGWLTMVFIEERPKIRASFEHQKHCLCL